MSPDLVPADPLIDQLVADLAPVRPRRWRREAALLIGLVAVEIGLFVATQGMRPDMPTAMHAPAFWWKSGSLAMIAILAAAAALISLDPAVTNKRRLGLLWRALGLLLPITLGLGWLLDASRDGTAELLGRLAWRDGLDCLAHVVMLSLPLALALALLLRRGASTQPGRTAAAAGIAAAAFGAFIFAFHCTHDDPLYVVVWYGAAVIGVSGLVRLVLARLLRW